MRAAIFLVLWVAAMLAFGSSLGIKADLSADTVDDPCSVSGHPLWEDC